MSDGPATTELIAAAKDAAARDTDYYALLDLAVDDAATTTPLTRDSVQRAWRKRSLKYHPDKAGAAFDAAKWEEFGLARDILASDDARAAYDAARSARLQKQRERDLMNAKQRRFAEELERAEAAAGAGAGAGAGSVSSRRATEEQDAQRAQEERDKERQAAEGRRYMEERKRKLREAEERDKERARREDEQRDDRIRELEDQIADKARRRAEKRAKREARKSGVAVADDQNVSTTTTTTMPQQSTPTTPVAPRTKPVTAAQKKATVPAVDIKMSDDPIQFWEMQWLKTKARLLAAQATKEKRLQEMRATA